LADKGVNLFIEKPPISSLENIKILEKTIKETEIITYVACNLRFHPCIQYIKEHLISKTKRINEINIYCGSYLPNWRPNKNFREIYSVNPDMGGGVHLDLYHEIDYTCWLFGIPEKSQHVLRNVSSLKIDSIDYANYLLEYESFSVNIILNYYRKDVKRSIEIIFEDETWMIDLIRNNIKNQNEFIIFENSDFSIEKSYYLQMQYFIEHSINKRKPMNCLKESLDVLKICLNNG
jgi:predicted dehydrogenase